MCATALAVPASLEEGGSASEVGNVEPFAWLFEEKRVERVLLRDMVVMNKDRAGHRI